MMVKGIQNSKPFPSAPLLKKTDTKLMGRMRKLIVIAVKMRARTCRPGIKINVNKAMMGKAKNANWSANSYVASCSRTFPAPHVSVAAASGSNTPLRNPSVPTMTKTVSQTVGLNTFFTTPLPLSGTGPHA